jgi:uncharacterized membrane protein YkvA (DUF1232 family)
MQSVPARFSKNFTDEAFWKKAKEKAQEKAKAATERMLEPAFKVYYAVTDPDTPFWAKAVGAAALGYFISPVDPVPDVVPILGQLDDVGALLAALGIMGPHIKPAHTERAQGKAREFLGR